MRSTLTKIWIWRVYIDIIMKKHLSFKWLITNHFFLSYSWIWKYYLWRKILKWIVLSYTVLVFVTFMISKLYSSWYDCAQNNKTRAWKFIFWWFSCLPSHWEKILLFPKVYKPDKKSFRKQSFNKNKFVRRLSFYKTIAMVIMRRKKQTDESLP